MEKILVFLVFIGLALIAVVTGESWSFAGVNIAQGKSTTQTPGTYQHYTSDLAVNGNSNTIFEAESCTHTLGPYNTKATWTVYLNGSYTLKGIRVFNRDRLQHRLKDFKIIGLPSSTVLHDDAVSSPQLFNDTRIDVAIDSVEHFTAITIEIPGHTGYPDNGISYLTLCEVQIYSENHDCPMPSPGSPLVTTLRQGTGYLNTAKGLVSTWTVLDFRCNGFYTLEGSEAIICVQGGAYNASVPTCTEITCQNPSIVLNGYYVQPNKDNYTVGDSVTWRCDQGYTSEQNRSRQCLQSATLSGGQPMCTRITCLFPGQVSNGYLQMRGTTEYTHGNVGSGTIVNVHCEEGFQPNVPEINCKEDGQWDVLPACMRVECNRLGNVSGGYFVYMLNGRAEKNDNDVYLYGTVATAVCNDTFFKASNEGITTRTCSQNSSWTGPEDLCVKNGCPLLNKTNYLKWTIRNGSGENSSVYGLVSPGAVIDFACVNDHSLVGTESIVCLQTGAYNTRAPRCTVTLSEEKQASSVAGIAGGVLGGFVVGIVVCIAVVWLLWKRKEATKQQKSSSVYMKPNPAFSSNIDGEHTYTDLDQI